MGTVVVHLATGGRYGFDRDLGIDLNRLYVLLRLGRLDGHKVNGEWRVCGRAVEERLRKRPYHFQATV